MVGSAYGKGRLKKTYLKAGKQSSSVINGSTSHKIIDRKKKESLCTFLL